MRGLLLGLALSLTLAGCDDILPRRSEGEKLYRRHCAKCHGNDAAGNTPRYMGNAWADLSDEYWKIGGTRVDLELAIREGVGEMPGFPDLTNREVLEIINYLREIRGEVREPER